MRYRRLNAPRWFRATFVSDRNVRSKHTVTEEMFVIFGNWMPRSVQWLAGTNSWFKWHTRDALSLFVSTLCFALSHSATRKRLSINIILNPSSTIFRPPCTEKSVFIADFVGLYSAGLLYLSWDCDDQTRAQTWTPLDFCCDRSEYTTAELLDLRSASR